EQARELGVDYLLTDAVEVEPRLVACGSNENHDGLDRRTEAEKRAAVDAGVQSAAAAAWQDRDVFEPALCLRAFAALGAGGVGHVLGRALHARGPAEPAQNLRDLAGALVAICVERCLGAWYCMPACGHDAARLE